MAGLSDLDRQIEQLRRCDYLKESEVKALCARARELLVDESNVERVDAPVTVRRSLSRRARDLPPPSLLAARSLARGPAARGRASRICARSPASPRLPCRSVPARFAATFTASSTT